MNVKLVSITQGAGEFKGKSAEDIIVYAARVSSSREDNEKFKDPGQLLNYCIRNKHWSVFETATMTLEIETSKAIGIQLLRHRSFTFQELSQRYAVVGETEPIEIRKQAASNRQSSEEVFNPRLDDMTLANIAIRDHMRAGQSLYSKLLKADVARECARMVLPMSTKTTIYMTGPIRSWIHLFDVRDDSHAQKEIQLIAKDMKEIFKKECPVISKAREY